VDQTGGENGFQRLLAPNHTTLSLMVVKIMGFTEASFFKKPLVLVESLTAPRALTGDLWAHFQEMKLALQKRSLDAWLLISIFSFSCQMASMRSMRFHRQVCSRYGFPSDSRQRWMMDDQFFTLQNWG